MFVLQGLYNTKTNILYVKKKKKQIIKKLNPMFLLSFSNRVKEYSKFSVFLIFKLGDLFTKTLTNNLSFDLK